jgi:hypothetical protein
MPISAFNGAATIAAWQNWFLRMSFSNTPLVLPWPLKIGLELATRSLLDPGDQSSVDFSRPAREPALVSPDSVSWRVFKNPVSLFIGGVTAVIMELAEPRVRTGVWEHTTFRVDPIRRLRRTGLAAMVTVYGARLWRSGADGERSQSSSWCLSGYSAYKRVEGHHRNTKRVKREDGMFFKRSSLQLLNWGFLKEVG